jgi:hypothetical protein
MVMSIDPYKPLAVSGQRPPRREKKEWSQSWRRKGKSKNKNKNKKSRRRRKSKDRRVRQKGVRDAQRAGHSQSQPTNECAITEIGFSPEML